MSTGTMTADDLQRKLQAEIAATKLQMEGRNQQQPIVQGVMGQNPLPPGPQDAMPFAYSKQFMNDIQTDPRTSAMKEIKPGDPSTYRTPPWMEQSNRHSIPMYDQQQAAAAQASIRQRGAAATEQAQSADAYNRAVERGVPPEEARANADFWNQPPAERAKAFAGTSVMRMGGGSRNGLDDPHVRYRGRTGPTANRTEQVQQRADQAAIAGANQAPQQEGVPEDNARVARAAANTGNPPTRQRPAGPPFGESVRSPMAAALKDRDPTGYPDPFREDPGAGVVEELLAKKKQEEAEQWGGSFNAAEPSRLWSKDDIKGFISKNTNPQQPAQQEPPFAQGADRLNQLYNAPPGQFSWAEINKERAAQQRAQQPQQPQSPLDMAMGIKQKQMRSEELAAMREAIQQEGTAWEGMLQLSASMGDEAGKADAKAKLRQLLDMMAMVNKEQFGSLLPPQGAPNGQ